MFHIILMIMPRGRRGPSCARDADGRGPEDGVFTSRVERLKSKSHEVLDLSVECIAERGPRQQRCAAMLPASCRLSSIVRRALPRRSQTLLEKNEAQGATSAWTSSWGWLTQHRSHSRWVGVLVHGARVHVVGPADTSLALSAEGSAAEGSAAFVSAVLCQRVLPWRTKTKS